MVKTHQASPKALRAPICFPDAQGNTRNGTITIPLTDKELLGITNAHVSRYSHTLTGRGYSLLVSDVNSPSCQN